MEETSLGAIYKGRPCRGRWGWGLAKPDCLSKYVGKVGYLG